MKSKCNERQSDTFVSATFVGISQKLLLFYWKCYIFWDIYNLATYSINYVNVKLINQFFTDKQSVKYWGIRVNNAAAIYLKL